MKTFRSFLLACFLVSLTNAQSAAQKNAVPTAADGKSAPSIDASQAEVTKPMAVTAGVLSQPERTEISDGGRAVFDFTVPKDGDYVGYAVVSAPDDDNNSFYVNIDTVPKDDPLMIWDIDLTNGFEERVANWRGTGEAGSGEFNPKVFKLTAGTHKLFLVGREPARLKSVSIRPVKK